MDSTVDDLTTDVIESCESKELDHLSLVAGMYDELEIGERIDEHIAQDFEQRKVSVGQATGAMVINGLGFVRQSLYLTPQFFEARPTERLIGEDIEPEHLHDDTLGGALDSLYDSTASTNMESRSYFEMCRHMRSSSSDSPLDLPIWTRPVFRFTASTTRASLRKNLKMESLASSKAIPETGGQTSTRSFST